MSAPHWALMAPALARVAGPVGVAVSGGSDSLALLLTLARGLGPDRVAAVTVDHNMRPESAREATDVAQFCAARGISHTILKWENWEGQGNLQNEARRARRHLIADWARGRGLAAVALGHTLDDQAETFLLRLARGSGVDGLAAMREVEEVGGIAWLRPMLSVRRETLRDWLRAQGVVWSDDPSNANPAFDRVRARRAMATLATLGLGPERLAATAAAMRRAREALEKATAELAGTCVSLGPAGDLWLDPAPLGEAAGELRLRLFAAALQWVSGAVYRPRLATLEAALGSILIGRIGHGLTLHGCVLRPRSGGVAIRREPARVAPPVPLAGRIWDGRWRFEGDMIDGRDVLIGALGARGLDLCPGWRDTGLARETLLGTPALWRGEALMAAPFAGFGHATTFQHFSAVSAFRSLML